MQKKPSKFVAGALVLLTAACLSAAEQNGPVRFDGERAFAHLKALVAIGPRPAGSPGAAKTRDYITQHISSLGLKVDQQAFTARTPIGAIPMVNLRVMPPGGAGPRLIIASHYDTKLFRDATF